MYLFCPYNKADPWLQHWRGFRVQDLIGDGRARPESKTQTWTAGEMNEWMKSYKMSKMNGVLGHDYAPQGTISLKF